MVVTYCISICYVMYVSGISIYIQHTLHTQSTLRMRYVNITSKTMLPYDLDKATLALARSLVRERQFP